MKPAVRELIIPGMTPIKKGKVRTIFEIDQNRLLFVASDRISAFDVVLPTPIPGKGSILTQISNFWFEKLKHVCPHHVLTTSFDDFPAPFKAFRDQLEFRSVIVKKARILPFEFIVRGYISGSLWKAYQRNERPGGIHLPPGLRESGLLPEPLFTPTTKAESGHDEPVSEADVARELGHERSEQIRKISLEIYKSASAYALARGIIIADTKFEFGVCGDDLIVCDELLTPDSSRFWPCDTYEPGKPQESFDKQYVRDYLETLSWDKTPPGPELPDEIIQRTAQKYHDAYLNLTGKTLKDVTEG
mgnify:FL=1